MERTGADLAGYGVEAARRGGGKVRTALLGLGALLMLVNLYLIFVWAPEDAIQGQVQRVFYFHVPIALTAFLAFFLVFVGSVGYLLRRTPAWDRFAHANAEVGVVFATLILITGSIWARPIWGVWWTWEPRLTLSLIMWLTYVAYLMLRAFAPTPDQAARSSAVLGVVGLINVPIVYYAVEWWRGVHPGRVVGPGAGEGALDPEMRMVLLFSLLTFVVLYVAVLLIRLTQARLEASVRGLTHALHDVRSRPPAGTR